MRLAYCSNVHPAADWAGVLRALAEHVPEVRAHTSPDAPFPLGLWLSRQAVAECERSGPERLAEWVEAEGCYVLTLNGFPFDRFHGGPVKERVYLPDWRDEARADHTRRLATLLDGWLPADAPGSISTVPVGWGPWIAADDLPAIRRHLVSVLEHLDALRQRSSKRILLALEPEPGCYLETVGALVRFVDRLALPPSLKLLLGICYDTCHQAVLFEDPVATLRLLREAGIPVAKVQASSAPRLPGSDPAALGRFDDGVWLHQTTMRTRDGVTAWPDLPRALAEHGGRGLEFRVHAHVPVFLERLEDGCPTTRPFLEEVLRRVDPAVPVEVETYTWHVLPPEVRGKSLSDSLVRELSWVAGVRAAAAQGHAT